MDSNSVNLPPVSTLTYIEYIENKRQSELKKKGLRCLIDSTSPKSEIKRLTFNAIVKNADGVTYIFSIARKIESANMNETVNIYKQILMDNVI